MGLIKFDRENKKINKSFKYSFTKDKTKEIDITNWRSIINNAKYRELEIVTEKYERFLVEDITLSELHEINYCNKTVSKLFLLTGIHLPCAVCNGKGKVDWISKIIQKPQLMINKKFDRNNNGYIFTLTKSDQVGTVYVSTPKLMRGEDLCDLCCGSGLNFVKDFKVFKKTIINYC